MKNEYKLDLTLAVAVIIFALLVLWILIPKIHIPLNAHSVFVLPSFVPKIFISFLCFLGVSLLFRTIVKIKREAPKNFATDTKNAFNIRELLASERLAIVIFSIFFIFVISLEYIGFVIPSIIFLGGMMKFFGQKNKVTIAVIMLLVPIILYIFFRHIAEVYIPIGELFTVISEFLF